MNKDQKVKQTMKLWVIAAALLISGASVCRAQQGAETAMAYPQAEWLRAGDILMHTPFCGDGAREAAEAGFGASATPEGCIVTTYISSRKAQFLPAITEGIRQTNL